MNKSWLFLLALSLLLGCSHSKLSIDSLGNQIDDNEIPKIVEYLNSRDEKDFAKICNWLAFGTSYKYDGKMTPYLISSYINNKYPARKTRLLRLVFLYINETGPSNDSIPREFAQNIFPVLMSWHSSHNDSIFYSKSINFHPSENDTFYYGSSNIVKQVDFHNYKGTHIKITGNQVKDYISVYESGHRIYDFDCSYYLCPQRNDLNCVDFSVITLAFPRDTSENRMPTRSLAKTYWQISDGQFNCVGIQHIMGE